MKSLVKKTAELQMALGDPAQSAQTKAAIVRDLLSDRATAATRGVLESLTRVTIRCEVGNEGGTNRPELEEEVN